ncbi:hypothetical protein [Alkalicoccus luteus]|uniref:hypothetical protein n=1 Tax=Alkalicoccus luteus TaxID=1237094 RepID=UPI00403327AD
MPQGASTTATINASNIEAEEIKIDHSSEFWFMEATREEDEDVAVHFMDSSGEEIEVTEQQIRFE